MPPSVADSSHWMHEGTALFLEAAEVAEHDIRASSALPGWSRAHVLAHVAANADALGNLMRWAATGVPTPMYSSPEDRAAGIEKGTTLDPPELSAWVRGSAEALAAAMHQLSPQQWQTPVVTAQGRTVAATEVTWMRSREVWVHALDLATGLSFADLPEKLLSVLCDDIVGTRARRSGPAVVVTVASDGRRWELAGDGQPTEVSGSLADVTAYLAGRGGSVSAVNSATVPVLPAWL